jgi:hypothetical protein
MEYYAEEITSFYDDVDKELKTSKQTNIIRRKYFIAPFGITDNEIFKYSNLMWELYETNSKMKCPYLLDGLIYQGLTQKYTVGGENKYPEYKWKPPNKNSIDFYIEFEKDPKTKQILTVFDNSKISANEEDDIETGILKDRYYHICNLYLGNTVGGVEKPIIFNRDKNLSQCSYI